MKKILGSLAILFSLSTQIASADQLDDVQKIFESGKYSIKFTVENHMPIHKINQRTAQFIYEKHDASNPQEYRDSNNEVLIVNNVEDFYVEIKYLDRDDLYYSQCWLQL